MKERLPFFAEVFTEDVVIDGVVLWPLAVQEKERGQALVEASLSFVGFPLVQSEAMMFVQPQIEGMEWWVANPLRCMCKRY